MSISLAFFRLQWSLVALRWPPSGLQWPPSGLQWSPSGLQRPPVVPSGPIAATQGMTKGSQDRLLNARALPCRAPVRKSGKAAAKTTWVCRLELEPIKLWMVCSSVSLVSYRACLGSCDGGRAGCPYSEPSISWLQLFAHVVELDGDVVAVRTQSRAFVDCCFASGS